MSDITALQKWVLPQSRKQAAIDMWDSMAIGFGQMNELDEETDCFFNLLKQHGMFNRNSRVLDVGCGTGKYALALAKQCDTVIGIDLSPKMLDIARQKADEQRLSNVEFISLDWHETDLAEAGYAKDFDLVIARMTPAIQSANTFMKLSEASRGWCIMSKPTKRRDPVSDAVKQLIGIEEKRENGDRDIVYAFELLWESGMRPYLDYKEEQWDMHKTLEEAYGLYINRLKTYRALTSEEEIRAKDYLQSIAVNGNVTEKTNLIVTTMYWKTK